MGGISLGLGVISLNVGGIWLDVGVIEILNNSFSIYWKLTISSYWILFSRSLGWPFGPPRSLSSSSSSSFSWKNRKPSIFKRSRKSWKILWILIYVSIYLLIFQSLKQINKFTIGTSHSVGAGEGSKPRLSRSTLLNIIYSSKY